MPNSLKWCPLLRFSGYNFVPISPVRAICFANPILYLIIVMVVCLGYTGGDDYGYNGNFGGDRC